MFVISPLGNMKRRRVGEEKSEERSKVGRLELGNNLQETGASLQKMKLTNSSCGKNRLSEILFGFYSSILSFQSRNAQEHFFVARAIEYPMPIGFLLVLYMFS